MRAILLWTRLATKIHGDKDTEAMASE